MPPSPLLLPDDRIDGFDLPLTHEFLAMMLSISRPGVTTVLQELERQGPSLASACRLLRAIALLGLTRQGLGSRRLNAGQNALKCAVGPSLNPDDFRARPLLRVELTSRGEVAKTAHGTQSGNLPVLAQIDPSGSTIPSGMAP